MRALILASMLVGCTELTSIGPERLPPPQREAVLDGRLEGSADTCSTLAPGVPIRLSASATDSTGVRIAALPLFDGGSLVGVTWLETPLDGEDPGAVALRLFNQDGGVVDTLSWEGLPHPTEVSIVPLASVGGFGLAFADDDGVTVALTPPWILPKGEELDPFRLPGLSHPSGVGLSDLYLLAALGPDTDGDGEGDSINIVEIPLSLTAVPREHSLDLEASAVEVAARADGAQLTWIHDGALHGASIDATNGWAVTASAEAQLTSLRTQELRSATSPDGTYLPIVGDLPDAGRARPSLQLLQLDALDRWILQGQLPLEPSDPSEVSIAVEERGSRIAVARSAGETGRIRLERASRLDYEFCSSPGQCLDVVIDNLEGTAPDIAAIHDGYAVAWSSPTRDDEEQRDVFLSLLACGPFGAEP